MSMISEQVWLCKRWIIEKFKDWTPGVTNNSTQCENMPVKIQQDYTKN